MSPRKKTRRRQRRKKPRPSRLRRRFGLLVLAGFAMAGAWLVWPFWHLTDQFSARTSRSPSRLYAAPTRLEVGQSASVWSLTPVLEASGYRAVEQGVPEPGGYRLGRDRMLIHLRRRPTVGGVEASGPLEVDFAGGRVKALRWRGEAVRTATLEPVLLTSYYGPDRQERWPVEPDELPPELTQAVLAAEDADFFTHLGLSWRGIARAAWTNLRGGTIRQGGSTLTQQLVKNLYLTPERTLIRKAREAVLALLLELRYDKQAILRAYLNEIYWGGNGTVSFMGVGSAARAYFGKEPRDLDLAECALLAGMIRAPANYAPNRHPERALERRNWVLTRMVEVGSIDEAVAQVAAAVPLPESPSRPFPMRARYFQQAAAAEAAERFSATEVKGTGLALLSTLRWRDQEKAEEAVGWGVKALEESYEKGRHPAGPLQAALVSVEPESGAILAYVGGRDYGASQFDRLSQARRQAGSAFKPVVYAAALEGGQASVSTLIEDAPLTVRLAGQTWSPKNSDGKYQGWISVRKALERSRNLPTARLGLWVGLDRVVELGRDLGIDAPLKPYPSLVLGAFEVSPIEMATVYATLAAGGRRPSLHALVGVLDAEGKPLGGRSVESPRTVLSPQAAYLVTSILQGVLDRGTAASVRRLGIRDPLAGKTGTTNDRRDSWFAGYSPDRVSLVWVGYDDNAATRLSGARAALPIWARFIDRVRPRGGYETFRRPPGVATAVIDPLSGELATDDCPQIATEVFLETQIPRQVCHLHGRGRGRAPSTARVGEPPRQENGIKKWLKKVFGKKKKKG